jgi:hypothetical protein
MCCKGVGDTSRPQGQKTEDDKEITMKLTRVILLALAFVIPTATTSLASAADEPAAAGDTAKPAKGKKGKKGKKDKKAGEETKEEAK